MSDLIRHLTDDSFDAAVIGNPRPVLVDFWANWCGPCKAMAPALDELAAMYEGEVDIVKVDIEANSALTARYSVRNIPLLVIFRNGVEVARSAGGNSKTRLAAFIDANS